MIRIANGQGFWGDWLEAPVRLVEQGPLDYLALDYLAEVTMSILQKQKQADPQLGYARDFPPLVARISRQIRERAVTVIANAGGVNPMACAREVVRLAPGLKVAVVLGDDVYPRIDEFLSKGYEMRDMDTGEPVRFAALLRFRQGAQHRLFRSISRERRFSRHACLHSPHPRQTTLSIAHSQAICHENSPLSGFPYAASALGSRVT